MIKYSKTQLHAWSEPKDYVRARRSTLPSGQGRPSLLTVMVMWLFFAIGLLVPVAPIAPLPALAIVLGSLVAALLVAFLAAWADFNARQTVILDRRRIFITGTHHPLETIRSVVVGTRSIDSRNFPILLVRMRDGTQHLIGRDDSVPDEVMIATFRELGIKVE